ncbi:MAG: ABC transporter permease [Anaerolineae bacterium]|nr:ABC transporter permease [Anaerolineae bacterium]
MNGLSRIQRTASRQPYLFALLLLVVVLLINLALQSNLFDLIVINRNLRVFLPLMVLVVGQTMVIIGGGIDLSVGAIVTLGNSILVTMITADSPPGQIGLAILVVCIAGLLAGVFNGFCVAYLRLQPIVTTYATSFVFNGLALLILPRPGGDIPADMRRLYRSNVADVIPFTVIVIIVLIILWLLLRSSRYAQFLFSTGSKSEAAYFTGVPVSLIKFTTYLWSGLFAALAALALTLNTGTGSPRIGDAMTLDSVVAVVLGGTRLSGGQGGVIGSMIGVIILGTIRNIISFANVPSWSQTLVNALIIIAALIGPGLVRLIRRLIAR